MHIERSPRHSRPIPLTPLIDVVFLLMVFFIVTTNFVKVEALKLGILDDASSSEAPLKASIVHQLVLLGNGGTFLNGELVYAGDLEDKLEVLFTRQPDAAMSVKSDSQVTVQMLVDMLDMIHRSGGRDVKVARWQPTASRAR